MYARAASELAARGMGPSVPNESSLRLERPGADRQTNGQAARLLPPGLLCAGLAKVRHIAIVAMAMAALAGCGDTHLKWNEQVKLASGELIVVERTGRFSENWIAGGGGGSINQGMTLQFPKPGANGKPGPWEGRLVPLVLDWDPEMKEWFMVATFTHCQSWYDLGRPKLPYAEFRFKGDRWFQQQLNPRWIGRDANLLPADGSDGPLLKETQPLLSVERKDSFFNNPAIFPKFKRIVDEWTTNC